MIRGHPNGNQDLEADDTIFVEFMQQYDEKIKQNRKLYDFQQKHAAGVPQMFALTFGKNHAGIID